uniref:KIAA0825 n=1 Tax=Amphiprion ocellaris TaxID=80972 RepID=A0A3Q1AHW2_AMPOC
MEWPGDFPDDHAFVDLLVPGAGSDLDFEQLLKDTEEKLNLNASSIEQQLKELQAKMGDSRTGDRPPSPTECLQWFNIRMQSRFKPASPGHQELMDFFRALQEYLRSEEEMKEEVTLQLLVNLSAQCGVCFPYTLSSSSSSSSSLNPLLTASIHLVHTVKDDSSLEIQEAWDDVRLRLRRYLMDRLSSRSPEYRGPRQIFTLSMLDRTHCLQQLVFLYPECEVLTHYQALRCQFVQSVLHSALSSSPGGETGFDRLAISFSSVVPVLTQALTEELQVLPRLAEPHTVLGFVNAAYLSTVAQELASLMEKECETAQRDNTALSSKIKKYSAKTRATVDERSNEKERERHREGERWQEGES